MATSMAAILAITAGAYMVLRNQGSGTDPVAAAAADLPFGHASVALEQARQQMIQLDAAAKTMTILSSPKVAQQPITSQADDSGGSGTTGGTGTSGGGGGTVAPEPAPDPGTAESIAYKMLPSFGFSDSGQYSCLYDLWERESGWVYNAENASGAYGIPQALPGDKMASAGPNWATDPTTQITWGLGYIKDVYGTPCGAWAHEEAYGYY
jgi:hypothetical protein